MWPTYCLSNGGDDASDGGDGTQFQEERRCTGGGEWNGRRQLSQRCQHGPKAECDERTSRSGCNATCERFTACEREGNTDVRKGKAEGGR